MAEGVVEAVTCPLETQAPAPAPALPDELLFEILLRLPIKNLYQCNCVSKAWQSMISSPEFVRARKVRCPDVGLLISIHEEDGRGYARNYYYFSDLFRKPKRSVCLFQVPCPDYHCGRVTEVIDGLVCFYDWNSLYVCNIFTKEVRRLPDGGCPRKYFLGFDVVNGVYKLLGVNLHANEMLVGEIEILTLGPGGSDLSWRKVPESFENRARRMFSPWELASEDQNFGANGVLYWKVIAGRSRRRARCYLISFDLNEEKFRCLKLPRGLTSRCLISGCFTKFRGRLALSATSYCRGYSLSLYVLEDNEGNLWTKHSIALPDELNLGYGKETFPVGNLPNGQMLLANQFDEETVFPVYSYDHCTNEFEGFFVGKFPRLDDARTMRYSINTSCLEENLAPFDALFDGAKRA